MNRRENGLVAVRNSPLGEKFFALDSSVDRVLYSLTGICVYRYINSVDAVFNTIAEPNRRAILGLLLASEQSVGELERQLGLPQPAVSKHLRVLRDAGIVEATVEAQRRVYRIKPEPLQQLDAWLGPFRRLWIRHVDALERHLDRVDPPSTGRKTPKSGKPSRSRRRS